MSQRNPNNDRYKQEKRTGVSRKSASSAKPKTKAASSVTMGSAKKVKTKEQTKAEKKAERAKDRERERKYYTPPTEHFKRLKKLWWACLIGAAVCTAGSFLGRNYLPQQVSTVLIIAAYGFIILALYLDLGKMRKERRKYAEEMELSKSKEKRAATKAEKRRIREAEMKAAEREAQEAAAAERKRPGLFGFGKSKKKGDTAAASSGDASSNEKQPAGTKDLKTAVSDESVSADEMQSAEATAKKER